MSDWRFLAKAQRAQSNKSFFIKKKSVKADRRHVPTIKNQCDGLAICGFLLILI